MHERANRLYLYVNKLNFARAIAMPPKKPYCEKKPSEGIGEKLKTKDWIYVVKRVFKRKEHNFELDEDEDFLLGKGGSGELRRAKGLFTFLDLELENLTLSPVHYFRIPDLELVDDKNRNFKTIEERDPLGNPVRFNPNVPQDLRMMWDMPLDSEGLLLEVPSGSRFEGSAEKLYIDLGNCDGKG